MQKQLLRKSSQRVRILLFISAQLIKIWNQLQSSNSISGGDIKNYKISLNDLYFHSY